MISEARKNKDEPIEKIY